ncbi:MAG TPA: biotin--[acetyl-CoA-carboxylase] ligase [Saprospiraceae bacterium]|nr:biotin--[acetyl-CoA-carboxylase] ligase [Saprospiraceae bacterium]
MTFDFPYLYLPETDSTNIQAMEVLSKTNPPNGFLVITDYQTAGKGQYGRTWQSEAGKNLLFSLICQPSPISLATVFRLHLACSLALIDVLEPLSIPDLSIKWPNDLYAGTNKLGGILIQNIWKGTQLQWTVIGIGINVDQEQFPPGLNATSIRLETGDAPDRLALASRIRQQLMSFLSISEESDWRHLQERYQVHLFGIGRHLLFRNRSGLVFRALLEGVNPEGLLCLCLEDNRREQYGFGEIEWLPDPRSIVPGMESNHPF